MSELNRIEHVAIRVKNLDWYLPFLRDELNFAVTEFQGKEESPNQIWVGGIQLTVDPDFVPCPAKPERVWHIGLNVEDPAATVKKVCNYPGVKPVEGKDSWIETPDGFIIEFVCK